MAREKDEDDYQEEPVKSKKKRKRSNDDDDSDEEVVMNEKKKANKWANQTEEQKGRIINEVVRFVVISESTKQITSRQDISKAVLQEKKLGNAFTAMLPVVTSKLRESFGWDLVTLPSFTSKGKANGSSKTDMLVKRSPELERFMVPIQDELPAPPQLPFLMIVLSVLLMHNFTIEETALLNYLTKFGLEKNAKQSVFQNKTTLELLKDLAKHKYILLTQNKEVGGTVVEVTMGARSLLEFGKVNILRFINKICGTPLDSAAFRELTAEQAEYMIQAAYGPPDMEEKTTEKQNGAQQANGGEDPPTRGRRRKLPEPNAAPEEEAEAPAPKRAKRGAAAAAPVEIADEEAPAPAPRASRRKSAAPTPEQEEAEEAPQVVRRASRGAGQATPVPARRKTNG